MKTTIEITSQGYLAKFLINGEQAEGLFKLSEDKCSIHTRILLSSRKRAMVDREFARVYEPGEELTAVEIQSFVLRLQKSWYLYDFDKDQVEQWAAQAGLQVDEKTYNEFKKYLNKRKLTWLAQRTNYVVFFNWAQLRRKYTANF